MIYKRIFSLILICYSFSLSAQIDWKLSSEKDGIKIYTSNVAGSKIKAVKVDCELQAKMSQIVTILMDIKNSPEWLYHTRLCRVVKEVSPQEIYYYSVVTLPWPAENRDFVCHLTVNQDPQTKIVTINGPAVPGLIPENNDMVRVNNSSSLWTITPMANNQLNVNYTLHVDPNGELPAWLVNMFGTEGPEQIFKNLRAELLKPIYKNAMLPYITN